MYKILHNHYFCKKPYPVHLNKIIHERINEDNFVTNLIHTDLTVIHKTAFL